MPQRGRGQHGGNPNHDRSQSESRSSRRDYKGKAKKDQNDQKRKKKTLADHIFNVGKAQDASDSDYVTNSKFIIRHIQTDYNKGGDITKALRDEKHIDFSLTEPRLKISAIDKTKEEDKYNQETAEFMEQYKINVSNELLAMYATPSLSMAYTLDLA